MTIENTELIYLTYSVIILNPIFFSVKKIIFCYNSDFLLTLISVSVISSKFLSKSCAN